MLQDENEDVMVRHEAGEALGAIGDINCIALLEKYSSHKERSIAETCQLARDQIRYFHDDKKKQTVTPSTSVFHSVDPAPASTIQDVNKLEQRLLDPCLPLFKRYRAMFALRDNGGSLVFSQFLNMFTISHFFQRIPSCRCIN